MTRSVSSVVSAAVFSLLLLLVFPASAWALDEALTSGDTSMHGSGVSVAAESTESATSGTGNEGQKQAGDTLEQGSPVQQEDKQASEQAKQGFANGAQQNKPSDSTVDEKSPVESKDPAGHSVDAQLTENGNSVEVPAGQLETPKDASTDGAAKQNASAGQVSDKPMAEKKADSDGMKASGSNAAMQAAALTAKKYDTPLAAGTYMIVTANSNTRVLDVAGGSKANGANVLLWDWHNAAWQKWTVAYDAEGYYTFTNVHTGKLLDVAAAAARNGANVLSWQGKSSGNANQRWILEKSGTGFILKSALNANLVLDCTGNSAANGTNIEIWQANKGANQRFNFVNLNPNINYGQKLPNGIYTMSAVQASGQRVEVQGYSSKNVANVDLYQQNSGMNQLWSFQYNGSGLYKVVNVGSGLLLDVEGASPTAASNVLQYAANGGKNQLWGVSPIGNDVYALYSALNGMALTIHGSSTANLTNIETNYSTGAKNQQFTLRKVTEDYSGTYRIFTRLSQDMKAVDVPNESAANGVQLALWDDNANINQRYVFEKAGSSYAIRPVISGKYLTISGGKIVQTSAQGSGGAPTNSQLWNVSFAGDGIQIKNVGTGKVMSVAGSKAVNNAKMQEAAWSGSLSQKFYMRACETLPRGLYSMASVANGGIVLDASGASFDNGANAIVWKSSNMNNQKFAITPISGEYYRVTLALGGTVLGVSGGDGASVKFYNWSGADSQLWKPVLVDGGFTLQNKASGMQLATAGNNSGNDVVQKRAANAAQQKWKLSTASINLTDMSSFVRCLSLASGSSSLTVSRAPLGFSTSSNQWKALQNALSSCWNAGIDVGFLSVDCNTGTTLSINADKVFYGASTIKGLYVTYLCEELLEKGRLSLGEVQDRMYDAIVYSDNYCYMDLRESYGSQAGFNAWLSSVGVGGLGMWDSYSPRTLAKAWVHMLEYENSGGRYVGFWRSIFDHSDYSSIKDSLGGYRTVYSKPGWMDGGRYGEILDDGGIVKGGGHTYVLAIMTSAYPYNWEKGRVESVVRAIDGVISTIATVR